jgi:hypothetical protein
VWANADKMEGMPSLAPVSPLVNSINSAVPQRKVHFQRGVFLPTSNSKC